MAPLVVKIKLAGKTHDVQLDPDQPATVFKDAVYQLTGVPTDRMKVMIKGGVLKDDTDWRKVGPKEGQTFMVIGAAGELPKPPSTPIVFLEDMDDTELAQALALPVGLVNLGNTCYMNSTVQAMRAIPELQHALTTSQQLPPLPTSFRALLSSMSSTTDAVTPAGFLNQLRSAFPQFAEMARGGSGGMKSMGPMYAQQDADECWTQMAQALRDVPGLPGPVGTSGAAAGEGGASADGKTFVEQWLMGELRRELKSAEAPEEPPSVTFEKVLKLECNITQNTNYMLNGIMNALDTTLTKHSPTLGRDAEYTSSARLSRLPAYLTVHMVRFAWRQDIQKKAKIMRRVKFPTDFDALELCTPELRDKLLPLSRRLKELEKERAERVKVRKRTKAGAATVKSGGDVEMTDASAAGASSTVTAAEGAEGAAAKPVEGGELEPESVYRERELKELEALVDADVKKDVGASVSGLFELVAIVTHKGAAADAGHYMAFVKKNVFHPVGHGGAGPSAPGTLDPDDDDWYKFDDNKVSLFPAEKLSTLDGGGEDSSAYVLLYRTRPLA